MQTDTRTRSRLLLYNPLAGIKREKEKNPRRPSALYDRYEKTRTAAQRLQLIEAATGCPSGERYRLKVELALVIVEATGRRISAVRNLR